MKRFHVIVSGRVQGVFFRAFTQDTAQALKLTGWVRNLFDGRVEAVFEGEDTNVQSMMEWCKKGPPHAVVKHVDTSEEPYTGEFRDFRITY
ncbi:MAG: acylphosphatase [Syntrophaceae bacterium]